MHRQYPAQLLCLLAVFVVLSGCGGAPSDNSSRNLIIDSNDLSSSDMIEINVLIQDNNEQLLTDVFNVVAAQKIMNETIVMKEDKSILISNALTNNDNQAIQIVTFNQGDRGGLIKKLDRNSLKYTPQENFFGVETFTYTVKNSQNEESLITVTLVVEAEEIPPVVLAESFSIPEDGGITFANLLRSKLNTDTDSLSLDSFTQGSAGGTVQEISPNVLAYRPLNNFVGPETFTYSVINVHGELVSSDIEISVTPVNDPPIANEDHFNTQEDLSMVLSNLLANDTDVDGDPLTITQISQGDKGGQIQQIAADVFRYTPQENFFGLETFYYTVSDENGGMSVSNVTLSVASLNDSPITLEEKFTVSEGESILLTSLLQNDTDIDGDSLSIISFSQGSNGGLVSQTKNNVLRFAPKPGFYGLDDFTYTASDRNGGTAIGYVTIQVESANDLPIVEGESFELQEDEAIILSELLNNDNLSITSFSQGSKGGQVSQLQNGTLRFMPKHNFYGEDSFSYTVSDENGGIVGGNVTLQIMPINDTPVVTDENFDLQEDETILLPSLLENDIDIDGDSLFISSFSQSSKGGLVSQIDSETLNFTPSNNFYGSDSFSYTVSDGNGGTATGNVTIEVQPSNDFPIVLGENFTTQEDVAIFLPDLLENDVDADGDNLLLTSFGQGSNGGVVTQLTDGSLRFTPKNNFYGSDRFSYTVNDGNGGISIGNVSIEIAPVNDIPVVTGENFSLQEDGVIVFSGLLQNDVDIDGDSLSITSFSQGNRGGLIEEIERDSFRYTPQPNVYGVETFNYTVEDGKGGLAMGTVTLQITAINDDPVVVGESIELKEDESIRLPNLLQNDSDVDNTALTISSVSQGDNGGRVTLLENDALQYQPKANFFGTETFIYHVSDGNGGISEGRVIASVSAVNDNPVVVGESIELKEDELVRLPNLLQNDSDVDNTVLTISSVSQGDNGGRVTLLENDTLQYQPKANFFGTETFFYRVSDGNGGISEGRVIATVTAVNNPPIANPDFISLQEDNAIVISGVLQNDVDIDGDSLSITSFSQGSRGGLIEKIGSDSFRYTPQPNISGSETFEYTVKDGKGGLAKGTVTLQIAAINDDPIVVGENIQLKEDGSITLPNLLQNDTDVDSTVLTISSVSQGDRGGEVTLLENDALHYHPKANFFGTETFFYRVSDGNGGISEGRVIASVSAVNDNPVVVGESIELKEDESIILPNLLQNDVDVDNTFLTISSVSQGGRGGKVTLLENNTLQYQPKSNFFGTETFFYRVSDGNGGMSEGRVIATVTAVNDRPIANSDVVSLRQFQEVDLSLLNNDKGLGDGVSLSLASNPKFGSISVGNSNNLLSYLPSGDYFGTDSFTYKLTDVDGETSVASVSLDIECTTNCTRVFKLSWVASASQNIVGYKVHIGRDENNFTETYEINNLTAFDYTATQKGEYFFAVSAINTFGIESELAIANAVTF